MVKWWNSCNGGLDKCKNAMVLFSYLWLIHSILFLFVLTESGGGPRQFLIHVFYSHYIQLFLCLPLLLPHNLGIPCALISLLLPATHHFRPPRAPLSLPLNLLHHLSPSCVPLYLYFLLYLPQPRSLSQSLPCCRLNPKTRQIIQCI